MPTYTYESEKTKYEHCYKQDAYRRGSPGEQCVDDFLRRIEPRTGVYDIGAGTGRAALTMFRKGHPVGLIDITDNSLDPQVAGHINGTDFRHYPGLDLRTEEARLLPPMTYGFCTDVMEHIPEDDVDTVLSACRHLGERGTYFRIFMNKDSGKFYHEPLHLTVKPATFWLQKLNEHWEEVHVLGNPNDTLIFTAFARRK